ncbi:protein transport protein S31 [Podochytrium sp. JEL0797]|nr:protein transport protein S31 [Podochytrium sp. JEL0797]
MLLTHIDRTAVVAWSPSVSALPQPLLACATAAGALDASFSTATALELFDPLSLSADEKPRFESKAKVAASARFHTLAWGAPSDAVKRPLGILAGGLENGELQLWDPRILLDNAKPGAAQRDALVMPAFKHKGPVKGLDFNPVDPKFLASGASDAEIYIWDLSAPTVKPYSPGPKSPRLHDITALAWNKMYHYILASASNNGATVIWDLRNRNEIACLMHPSGRRQISSISWNPDSPTQIVTASDDDASPEILMWDLRNSRAPEKVLSGHTKGVLNVSWCPKDSDLLLSCGKDNRTIVWDPSGTGTVLGDLHHSSNWSFEAQWCNRNPDLIAIAGFDGKVSIHSLQGNTSEKADETAANALAAKEAAATTAALQQDPHAFFTQASFGNLLTTTTEPSEISDTKFRLPHAPKWLRRRVGCSWGFGNRLVRFSNTRQPDGTSRPFVSIRNVVSEPAFVSRATDLDNVMAHVGGTVEQLMAYCETMAGSGGQGALISEKDRDLWRFLGVMFETGSREQVLQFLGFDKADVAGTDKLAALLKKLMVSTEPEVKAEVAEPEAAAAEGEMEGLAAEGDDFAMIAAQNKRPATPVVVPATPFKLYSAIPSESNDTDALIMKSLTLGNFETAVRICFGANRLADALAFAICGGQELLSFAQQEYFKRLRNEKSYIRVLNNIVEGDLNDIVENAQIDAGEADWKDLLALICTYGRTEDLPILFSTLGRRLETIALSPISSSALKTTDWKGKEEKKFAAVLCYLVAGDLSKVLHLWTLRESEEEKLFKTAKNAKTVLTSPATSRVLALESLIEKVQVFRQAIEFVDVELVNGVQDEHATQYSLDTLYQRYVEYAETAANQGLLSVAWKTLQLVPEAFEVPKSDPLAVEILKDRLFNSGLVGDGGGVQPKFPFEFVDIAKPAPVVVAPVVANGYGGAGYQQQQQTSAYGGYQQQQQQYPAVVPQAVNRYPSAGGNAYGQQQQPQQQNQYGYGQQSSSYGQQSGYAAPPVPAQNYGYGQQPPAPRAAFAPPPPPTVNTGYGAPTPSMQQSQFQPPLPPTANSYGQQQPVTSPYGGGNAYNNHNAVPPPPPASAFAPPPPVAARSVSHSAQYAGAPHPQAMGQTNSYAGYPPAPGPSSSVPPPQAVAAAVPAGPQKPASGDRSQIKPANMPIVTGLDALMSVCKESKTQPQQKREWEDTEKKVMNLFDQMNNGKVADDILAKLATLVKFLQAADYSAAHKIQVELMTTKFTATASWIVGVKRVIDTLERAELDKQQLRQPQQQQMQPPPSQYGAAPTYGAAAAPPPPPPKANAFPPPPPASAGYGSAPPPPSAAQQYAPPPRTAVPPPPPATSNPYGGAPPPAAASNPYGVAPPPAAASNPYGGAPPPAAAGGYQRPAPPPPAAGNPYAGQAPNQYGAAAPMSNQYGGGAMAPPPPAAAGGYQRPPAAALPPPPTAAQQHNQQQQQQQQYGGQQQQQQQYNGNFRG